nr:MAG TPA: hypothetical protein [Caudoviricetes sp.]
MFSGMIKLYSIFHGMSITNFNFFEILFYNSKIS